MKGHGNNFFLIIKIKLGSNLEQKIKKFYLSKIKIKLECKLTHFIVDNWMLH